ncbi:restriction endonuclease subunit S, partial [Staphylococcus epidermidis]
MIEHTNTPELRFSEFKEEWISKYVGEYFFFKNGLNKGKEFFGSGSPIVNFTDVFNNRGLYSKTING